MKPLLSLSIVVAGLVIGTGDLGPAFAQETASDSDPASDSGLTGRIESTSGAAVVGARLEWSNSNASARTDADGRFEIARPPVEGSDAAFLLISHPRFETRAISPSERADATENGGEEWVITLAVKHELYEEIVVSAGRDSSATHAPRSISASRVDPAESAKPPATLLELVESVPGVSENGQGGLFQVFSIRGVSRQRIMTLVDGIPINSERRAGASVSFVDPLLLDAADVVRGPASSLYGSRALGGVVQIFPRQDEGLSLATGYQSQGDERYLAVGWGDEAWSLGIARRQADNAESADGGVLFSRFEQTSATLARRFETDSAEWRISIIPTLGEDIGKANSRFPEQPTIYPRERHLMVKAAVETEGGWTAYAYLHPNDLVTETTEDGVLNRVENEAFDLGFDAQRRIEFSDRWSGRIGLEYAARRAVTADEFEGPVDSALQPLATSLDDATQDEVNLYATASTTLGAASLTTGARGTWFQQSNDGGSNLSDEAINAFAGVSLPLAGGFELTANVGTGLRFPSLSERFFSGTTGRGEVVGNPDLDPERSLNTDLGLRFYGDRLFVAGSVFRNQIDSYIERIEVEPDRLAFVNRTEGTLTGIELESFFEMGDGWRLGFGGHAIDGEARNGDALSDVPPHEVYLEAALRRPKIRLQGRWAHRFEKNDPGSGENAIGSAELVSASVAFRVGDELWLDLNGSNLLDKEYFPAADRRAPLAVGRSLGLGLRWRR